jgi:hypothetical protein
MPDIMLVIKGVHKMLAHISEFSFLHQNKEENFAKSVLVTDPDSHKVNTLVYIYDKI